MDKINIIEYGSQDYNLGVTCDVEELDDVQISNVQDGQQIVWNATLQQFVNQTV